MVKSVGKSEGFRILLISDLHIKADKNLTYDTDQKREIGDLAKTVSDQFENFFSTLDKIFKDVPKQDLPEAVIVLGDLVNRGGLDKDGDRTEFDVARKFLFKLANRLNIREDKILIVPGNHDVDWSSDDLDLPARFQNYFDAVESFSSPTIVNKFITPKKVELSNIKEECYNVEIFLLVSPTYSGIADSEDEQIVTRILKPLEDFEESLKNKIRQKLKAGRGSLDIAAIGRHQRNFIQSNSSQKDNVIRIAVMHHHLLPDTQLKVANFEAVLDSGKVLNDLIDNDFDLVLTGHKHNRKFINISLEDRNRSLDVFSSPSLFLSTQTCAAGFSLIEINKPSSSYYGHIHCFQTLDGQKIDFKPLERKGRVLPALKQACAEIPIEIQKKQILPLMNSIKNSLEWNGGNHFNQLFNKVWKQIQNDFSKLGNRTLVFRSPYLNMRWKEIIELADRNPPGDQTLKFVSEEDIIYWISARDKKTEAAGYIEPLKKFKGKKERILIFNFFQEKEINELKRINDVIHNMIDDGFKIYVLEKHTLPPLTEIERDFAIIGGFAVGHFDGVSKTGGRSLEQSFSPEAIIKAQRNWKTLCKFSRWNSELDESFSDWLLDIFDININESN